MKRLAKVVAAHSAVTGAEDAPALDTAIDKLEEDFSYIIAGLEKLGREGVNASNNALVVAENLSKVLQDYIEDIAKTVSSDE